MNRVLGSAAGTGVSHLSVQQTQARVQPRTFILDVSVGWSSGGRSQRRWRTDLALDALDMGLWSRQRAGQHCAGLYHHSDRGVQYRAIRYTERLAEAEAVASVGSKSDQLRQRDGRGMQLAVQGRVHPQPDDATARRLEVLLESRKCCADPLRPPG